jgi:hypothetical protein
MFKEFEEFEFVMKTRGDYKDRLSKYRDLVSQRYASSRISSEKW